MELGREYPLTGQRLLYPLMVIAAVAVILFSIVGIATITGWMPNALLGGAASVIAEPDRGLARNEDAAMPVDPRSGPAFQCAECGVIESIREIERRGALASASLAASSLTPTSARASGS